MKLSHTRAPRALLAVTLGLCGVLLPACGSDNGPDPARATSSGGRPGVVSTLRTLRAEFGVLRRSRGARDRLPDRLVPPFYRARYGLDPSASRLAYVGSGIGLYVMPGRGFLCLLGSDRVGANCWPTRTARDGDATSATLCSPYLPRSLVQLTGIVPDGVERVIVERPGWRGLAVPVEGNAFVAYVPAVDPLPIRVRWTRHGQPAEHPSGIPRGVKAASCSDPARTG